MKNYLISNVSNGTLVSSEDKEFIAFVALMSELNMMEKPSSIEISKKKTAKPSISVSPSVPDCSLKFELSIEFSYVWSAKFEYD